MISSIGCCQLMFVVKLMTGTETPFALVGTKLFSFHYNCQRLSCNFSNLWFSESLYQSKCHWNIFLILESNLATNCIWFCHQKLGILIMIVFMQYIKRRTRNGTFLLKSCRLDTNTSLKSAFENIYWHEYVRLQNATYLIMNLVLYEKYKRK